MLTLRRHLHPGAYPGAAILFLMLRVPVTKSLHVRDASQISTPRPGPIVVSQGPLQPTARHELVVGLSRNLRVEIDDGGGRRGGS